MPSFRPLGGIYDDLGYSRRNEPVEIFPVNPLPDNAMSNDTGNAGADGYTVLSRASRETGRRPMINGVPQYEGPNMTEQE